MQHGHCDTGSEDADNHRFMADCALNFKWPPVTILRSEEYKDTWDVWQRRKYLAGINGAPCTGELKIKPRLAFQRPDDIHIWGYTSDKADVVRAESLARNYFEMAMEFPLIERPQALRFVLKVLIAYGGLSPGSMVDVTHAKNGPWDFIVGKSRHSVVPGMRIPGALPTHRSLRI